MGPKVHNKVKTYEHKLETDHNLWKKNENKIECYFCNRLSRSNLYNKFREHNICSTCDHFICRVYYGCGPCGGFSIEIDYPTYWLTTPKGIFKSRYES